VDRGGACCADAGFGACVVIEAAAAEGGGDGGGLRQGFWQVGEAAGWEGADEMGHGRVVDQ